ncbi:hypothetical protein V5799_017592 [Amblyomma americanum]|uniref:Uncharacterized protein n=1 Tax=Amblyomma americanum TaxID=6943 RepID=A0AAQ4F237_AMBAM
MCDLFLQLYFQAGGYNIDFSHYQLLFETERKKHLKVFSKLAAAHVQRTNLQRMNMWLAVSSRTSSIYLMKQSTTTNIETCSYLLQSKRQNLYESFCCRL